MKPPINSFADDFGITFEEGYEKGIFSSTRKGRGNDDLYTFELPPLQFSVTGLVKDEKTGAAIPSSTVQLIASDGSNLQAETGTGRRFQIRSKTRCRLYISCIKERVILTVRKKRLQKGRIRAGILWSPFFLQQ